MLLVVDAGLAVKWLVPEPLSDAAERLLGGAHDLIAPDLLLLEAAAAVWKKARRDELALKEADAAMAQLANIPVELRPAAPLVKAAFGLARRIAHPVYDCVYLALAERDNGMVVTADARFRDQVRGSASRGRILWIDDVRE